MGHAACSGVASGRAIPHWLILQGAWTACSIGSSQFPEHLLSLSPQLRQPHTLHKIEAEYGSAPLPLEILAAAFGVERYLSTEQKTAPAAVKDDPLVRFTARCEEVRVRGLNVK